MTTEQKIIKHTLLSVSIYLIVYTVSTSILLSIIWGINVLDGISLLFVAFPSMFTGNLLPSVIGYGAIYLYNKTDLDNLVVTRSRYITAWIILGIESLGTLVRYAYVGSFVGASSALIMFLIFSLVKINKKYKQLKYPPVDAPVENEQVVNNDDIQLNDVNEENMEQKK